MDNIACIYIYIYIYIYIRTYYNTAGTVLLPIVILDDRHFKSCSWKPIFDLLMNNDSECQKLLLCSLL